MRSTSINHPLAFQLPPDGVFRRVHSHSAIMEGARFDLHLVEFSQTEPCWDANGTYVQPITPEKTVTVRVGVGGLPALSLNQIYRGRALYPARSVLPQQSFRLNISSGGVRSLESVGLSREQYGCSSPSTFNDSNVAVYDATDALGAAVKVVIPCIEVLRLFYTPHAGFANALLRGASYDEAICRLLNMKKSRVEEADFHVYMRWFMHSDRIGAQCAALLALDPGATEYARRLSMSNRTDDFFNALIPTSRPSLAVVGETLMVRDTAIPTYFLLRLIKTENPLPMSVRHVTYTYEMRGSRSQLNGPVVYEGGGQPPSCDLGQSTSLFEWLDAKRHDAGDVSDRFPWSGRDGAWENSVTTHLMSRSFFLYQLRTARKSAGELRP